MTSRGGNSRTLYPENTAHWRAHSSGSLRADWRVRSRAAHERIERRIRVRTRRHAGRRTLWLAHWRIRSLARLASRTVACRDHSETDKETVPPASCTGTIAWTYFGPAGGLVFGLAVGLKFGLEVGLDETWALRTGCYLASCLASGPVSYLGWLRHASRGLRPGWLPRIHMLMILAWSATPQTRRADYPLCMATTAETPRSRADHQAGRRA